jgi:proton-translocating NADH-quinone oxidoreductase chain M
MKIFITNILLYLIFLPFLGILFLIFVKNEKLIKNISIFISFLTFLISILIWILFDNFTSNFQFLHKFIWLSNYNINVSIGLDGISLFFIILTTFLIPLCLLTSYNSIKKNIKEYYISFLFLEFFLLIIFSILDIFFFYIFFESILIPMFLIIGIWGSRERKIRASYLFFIYTLGGSLLMLLAIISIYQTKGTTDYNILLNMHFEPFYQKIYWLAFFASFAVKVPMLPFHIWLPEAHVEAPTAGSVILAGILLKLGSYGLLRFSMPLFPLATVYFTPLVCTLCVIAIIYTSLTAIRQTDIKRIIAYASVAHMNLIILGMFSLNLQGIEGAIIQMLSHGLVSSALFLCIGVLYDRYHTRLITYYSGLVHTMPIFICFFFLYIMANIALPGTSSFTGELLILLGIFQKNTTITFFGATGMVLGGAYSLWLFNRIAFGNIQNNYLKIFYDISYKEFLIHVPLSISILIMGIYPKIFLDSLHASVYSLVLNILNKLI